jgi:hypothetical protein
MLVFERTWELLEITHSMITGDSVHNNAERYDNNQIVIIRLLYNCPSLLASLGLDRFDSFRNLAIKSALCSKMIQQNFGNSAIIITDDFRFDLNSEMCQTLLKWSALGESKKDFKKFGRLKAFSRKSGWFGFKNK